MKKQLFIALIVMILLYIIALISCSPIKKDQKAIDRVLGSRTLIDKVSPEVIRIYPCVPTEVKIGTTDTLISILEDTAQIGELRAELSGLSNAKEINIDSLKSALISQIKPVITVKTIIRVDTIADNQKIAILNNEIANNIKIHEQDLQTIITQSAVISSAQASNRKYIGALICFALIVFGAAGMKIYTSFKL